MKITSTRDKILADCAAYCAVTGIEPTRLGFAAIQDARMTARLANGGSITTNKMDQLYAFMAGECPHIVNPMLIEDPNGNERQKAQRTKEQAAARRQSEEATAG